MKNKVIVITGASSGIGKATALELARRGARLVVTARRQQLLDELVNEIEKLGSVGFAYAADVTDEEAIHKLAKETYDHFGAIDVWINNAANAAFGNFENIPSEVFKRVIEVNILGYVNGVRAVLPYFKGQHSGIIINVSSVVGVVAQPYATPYTASKFAIRGLSEALRSELEDIGIHVSTVLPAAIDTPFFQHAANYSGKALKPLNPTYKAEDVAEKIIEMIENPKSEVYAGTVAPLLANAHKFVPDTTEKTFAAQVRRDHFQLDKDFPFSAGNVFEPMMEGTETSGGWKE